MMDHSVSKSLCPVCSSKASYEQHRLTVDDCGKLRSEAAKIAAERFASSYRCACCNAAYIQESGGSVFIGHLKSIPQHGASLYS